jgi:hypothetical protein
LFVAVFDLRLYRLTVSPGRYLLRAFVDETGDRGMKESSSSYFAFAAVICRDANTSLLLSELDSLVGALGKPPQHVLHWSKNMKDHTDRKHAALKLSGLPVRLIYVVVPKSSVRPDSHLARSTEGYYNYAARLLLERIGLFTRTTQVSDKGTETLRCKVTFGQVKGFNPTVLRDYIAHIRKTDAGQQWDHLTPTIDVAGQGTARPLQWADMAAGALDSAIKPDRHGDYEPTYWHRISHLVDRVNGRMLRCGLKVLGDERCITGLPWWDPSTR